MTLLDKLIKYFNTTSKEKVQEDWDSTPNHNKVVNQTIPDIFVHWSEKHKIRK